MYTAMILCSVGLLTIACAPLHPHTSVWGDIGEVTGRVLACPLTLCTSELILYSEYQSDQRQQAYQQWYWSLSPEERRAADAREAARMQALGMALSGSGPLMRPLPPSQAPRPAINCTSYAIGDRTYVNCP